MPATLATPAQSQGLNAHTTTMKAVTQAQYGLPEVLQLEEVQQPPVGNDDVLLRVHAAGLHIGDWHVMTGEPRLMRIVGFGLRAPKARVRGMDVVVA
jgi:NADPH:quinone reductase-like Zn-dependent oxidoreductase